MAENDFLNTFKGWFIAGIFVLSIVSFVAMFSADNRVANPLDGAGEDNLGDFSGKINEINDDAESWKDKFLSDSLFVSLGAVVLFSIFGIVKLVFGTILGLAGLILTTGQEVLGLPPVVTGGIITLAVVSLIFYGWKVIKAGD